jgi:hypothetical protein
MGIEEGGEVQAKRICNIINKIRAENFPNLEKECPFRYRKPPGHQTDVQDRTTPQHIIVKAASTEDRERILKTERKKN